MNTCVAFLVVLSSLSLTVNGDNCKMLEMQDTIRICIEKTNIMRKNKTHAPGMQEICDNAIRPMIDCLEPNITACVEKMKIPVNGTQIRETAVKVCNGMKEFLKPDSTRGCSVNQLKRMTCVEDSGLMTLANITDLSLIPGTDYFCKGRLDTLVQCVEGEISDCGDLFGIPTDLTWLRDIVKETCTFLSQEENCDLPRMPDTGFKCFQREMQRSKLNFSAPWFEQLCGSTFVPGFVDCLKTNITACGRMMGVTMNTEKIKEAFNIYCEQRPEFGRQAQCIERQMVPMQKCGYREMESFITMQTEYYSQATDITIKSALNKYLCGYMQVTEVCFYESIAMCKGYKEVGEATMQIAIPDGCKLRFTSAAASTAISAMMIFTSLFLTLAT